MNDATPHSFAPGPNPAAPIAANGAENAVAVEQVRAVPQAPSIRLWPAVVLLVLQWIAILVPAQLAPGTMFHFYGMFMGGLAGGALIGLWWLFASRVGWRDKILLLAACVAIAVGMYQLYHPSFDMFGVMIYGVRTMSTAWVGWLLLTPFLSWPLRRAGLLAASVAVWGFFALIRFDGVYGNMVAEMPWRWAPTDEELFQASRSTPQALPVSHVDVVKPGDWPSFRGPGRDGRLTGVKLAANWNQYPPKLLWKQPVGPGWSSFAVVGSRAFTQMQWESDKEGVVCLHAETGKVLWVHTDPDRFYEKVAGAGPRATPTFHEGKIYALGATGKLNCLDAASGAAIWSVDITDLGKDTKAKVPDWGFASSPLVHDGVVTVFVGGPDGKSVVAYDAANGQTKWYAGEGQLSYCSPQLAKLAGGEQLLIATDAGLFALQPKGGQLLWKHSWPVENVARIVQPAIVSETDVLIGTGMDKGTRRLHVTQANGSWTSAEVWTTRKICPYYNDMVIYQDHLYGFNGEFLTCVALKDGKPQWKERGYGNGQVLLLADQGTLLVLSEQGEVALVEATPSELRELCRFQALEGKTWNHPVVANGKLFVRNGKEAACFALEVIGN